MQNKEQVDKIWLGLQNARTYMEFNFTNFFVIVESNFTELLNHQKPRTPKKSNKLLERERAV